MFAFFSAFASFFTWKEIVNFVWRSVTFSKMVIVNTALLSALIAYVWAVLKLIMFVYDKTNEFISLINNISGGSSNEILSWAMDIFRALGIWNAFVDVYNIFSVPIVSIFTIYASKLGLKFLHSVQRTLMSYSISKL